MVLHGDCLDLLDCHPPVTCIFADPPDNISLDYHSYDDKLPSERYLEAMREMILQCTRLADIFWLSFNPLYVLEFAEIVKAACSLHGRKFKDCVQVFTFGQHNNRDLGTNHRPLWRIMKPDAVLYPENIKVPSWRQRNGDKRAKPGGRVPGDVFDMECPQYLESGSVFDFPRVTGNSAQRQDWCPTQLHEALVERCVLLSTDMGDSVLDPYAGSGTTLRVCLRNARLCTTIDTDLAYCKIIAQQCGLTQTGAVTWVRA